MYSACTACTASYVIINQDRWRSGVPRWTGSLTSYRRLVLHAVHPEARAKPGTGDDHEWVGRATRTRVKSGVSPQPTVGPREVHEGGLCVAPPRIGDCTSTSHPVSRLSFALTMAELP